MDLCIESPYMPSKGETIAGSNFLTNSGGKGANQATAASIACTKKGAQRSIPTEKEVKNYKD